MHEGLSPVVGRSFIRNVALRDVVLLVVNLALGVCSSPSGPRFYTRRRCWGTACPPNPGLRPYWNKVSLKQQLLLENGNQTEKS